MPDLCEEDRGELSSHRFCSEASRVMANVLARCIRYTEKCDEQMTARMQRKNRQVNGMNGRKTNMGPLFLSEVYSFKDVPRFWRGDQGGGLLFCALGGGGEMCAMIV